MVQKIYEIKSPPIGYKTYENTYQNERIAATIEDFRKKNLVEHEHKKLSRNWIFLN